MAEAIEVNGLTKRFGATLAVDDLSFTVAEGRIVGFLGPNGAGKTTTLRVLLGPRPADGGATTHPGRRVQRAAGSGRHGRRGARRRDAPSGPQRPQPPARARPGRRPRAARVEELLELVGLDEAADRRVGGYSLGMRQRLGLAAALLGDPRVLILDEPANGLDPQGIRWLRDFLRTLAAEGRAILVSSHVLAEVAQTADDVVVIHKGRSIVQSPLGELMARSGGGVRVAGPDVGRLGELLRADGATVERRHLGHRRARPHAARTSAA